jgi:hypothetical protein
MRFLFLVTLLAWGYTSSANEFKCKVEFHKESAKANTGALICGEFNFDSKSETQKKQNFEKCQNLTVEYKAINTPKGLEYFFRLSAPQNRNSEGSIFAAKELPSEFRIENMASHAEKKHVLEDTHILDCQQIKVE